MKKLTQFQFNMWKHHLGFIKSQIEACANQNDGMNKAKDSVKVIGESLTDLYLGKLSTDQIFNKIVLKLNSRQIRSRDNFSEWILSSGLEYRIIQLVDKSRWVLRIGDDPKKFIHLHPAKHSPHTLRIRAKTLKTAILVSVYSRKRLINPFELSTINSVRKEYLGEAPIKSVNTEKGLGKIIQILL